MRVNQLKAGTLLAFVTMALSLLISLTYTPLMLRLLGQNQYGLYTLVQSLIGSLWLLSFGFGGAYVRYYMSARVDSDEESIPKLNTIYGLIYCGIGLVTLIVGIILTLLAPVLFADKLSSQEIDTARVLMVLFVINAATAFPFTVFYAFVTVKQEFLFQKLVNVVKMILLPLLSLPLLLMGYKVIGLALVSIVLSTLVDIINAAYCFKKLKMRFTFKHLDFSLIGQLTTFSAFIFLIMISDTITWSVDKILLGVFQGTTAIAIYGIAAMLNTYYVSFSTAISGVFVPRVHSIVSSSNDNEVLTELFTKVGRLQFCVLSLVVTGYIFFGRNFIILWAGQNYEVSYYIGLILMIPITIPLIQNLGIEIQRAKDMHKFSAVVFICIAVANIAISIPLCKMYSGVGSAIGTAIAILLGQGLAMNIYYHKKVGINIIHFWKNIASFLPALIIPAVFGVGYLFFFGTQTNASSLIIGIVVYMVVFVASLWAIGLNTSERRLIGDPLLKVWRRSGMQHG